MILFFTLTMVWCWLHKSIHVLKLTELYTGGGKVSFTITIIYHDTKIMIKRWIWNYLSISVNISKLSLDLYIHFSHSKQEPQACGFSCLCKESDRFWIKKYPGHTFISEGEKKMLRNRLGVHRVLRRAGSLKGKKIGEFHWSISLHFVQFRSISFLFIRRREAPGHKEGEGGSFPGRISPRLADLLSVAEEQPRFSNFDILSATAQGSYFILLKDIWFGWSRHTGELLPTSLLQPN